MYICSAGIGYIEGCVVAGPGMKSGLFSWIVPGSEFVQSTEYPLTLV